MIFPANRIPIHAWASEDRPREKLINQGIQYLTDAELLATLLATGTRDLSALSLARKLIDHFGGLPNLSRVDAKSLMRINGVGQAKASAIIAAFELGRRRNTHEARTLRFEGSNTLGRYLVPKIGDLPHEVFYIIYLDRNSNFLGEKEIYRGGMTSVSVDARHLFKEAMETDATSVVVCHNHPSGSVSPSHNDDVLTQHLVSVAHIVGVRLLDHLIVTSTKWYSYANQGRIEAMYEIAKEKLKDIEGITLEPKERKEVAHNDRW
jgi:DNA repair protein RadC